MVNNNGSGPIMNDGLKYLIERAIAEDLAGGIDVTSHATIPENQQSVAQFVNRQRGVIAGIPAAMEVLKYVGITDIHAPVTCAHETDSGTVILEARGNTRSLLLAERTALNFLTHMSGIATLTRRWVDAISGTNCIVRDTRKTTPGWRELEKEAVRMGGGENHRMSLSESVLIKDNHILAAGGVLEAFKAVKAQYPDMLIEVEVDTLDQLSLILTQSPDLVLLDNMSVAQCKEAVGIVQGKSKLEASGGLSLDNALAYAQTGVDYLAVGALTHSAQALDIGLDLRMEL
ncbi:MAG: carboxylating nicotinate-nucleotide diphosphorylase [Actinomycetes bacterium]